MCQFVMRDAWNNKFGPGRTVVVNLPNGKCHRGKALDRAVIDPHMQKATIHVDGLFGAVPLETCRPVLKRSEQCN